MSSSSSSNGRVTSADWRDEYRDTSLLLPEAFDASFFDIQPVLNAAASSRQVSVSPPMASPAKSTSISSLNYLGASGKRAGGGNTTKYSFPPMPSLGATSGKNPRGLSTQSWYDPAQLPAVEQAAQEEWTPEKDGSSSNKRKRTAGPSPTNARKKRAAATRRRHRADSVPDAVEDAVTELGKNDVAMGRGGMANNHIGNKNFRKMAWSLKPEYQKLQKEEKTDFSIKLVQMVHDKGGRFLAKDPADELWYEVDFKLARRKASQALREETRQEREYRMSREANDEDEYEYY